MLIEIVSTGWMVSWFWLELGLGLVREHVILRTFYSNLDNAFTILSQSSLISVGVRIALFCESSHSLIMSPSRDDCPILGLKFLAMVRFLMSSTLKENDFIIAIDSSKSITVLKCIVKVFTLLIFKY